MYYEGKVRNVAVDENGKEKNGISAYVIGGCNTCGEAIERLTNEVAVFAEDIIGVKQCAISDFINDGAEGDNIYTANIEVIELDEKSGKEHSNCSKFACFSNTLEEATAKFKAYLRAVLVDCNIVSIKRSKYNDLI